MKKPNTPSSDRKFFFMVAATIVFQVALDPKNPEATVTNSMPLNAVVTSPEDKLPSALIGRAQQAVQMQFIKKMGDEMPTVKIVDVVITNLMNLGYMTDAEFSAVPEGLKQTEALSKARLSVVSGATLQ